MAAPSHALQYLLPIIAMSNFSAGLTSRVIDPVIPQISEQLAVHITTAASLASASAIAFAVIQLPLGLVADFFGKPKVILICLIILALANVVGSYATSFELLLATRVIAGLAAGGVFPVGMGLTGDLFPVEKRRVAMSRIMAGALTGNLLGAAFSGLVGDLFGWRGVLQILGCFILLMSFAVAWGFRNQLGLPGKPVDASLIAANYRRIVKHPHARLCYLGVFTEGLCIMGLLPFVAAFLQDLGEPRLSIAGLVIGGYAVGGLVYAATISRLVVRLGDNTLMIIGAVLISSQIAIVAFGPPWQVQFINFTRDGLRLLPDPRRLPGVHLRDCAGRARQRGVAAGVLLQLRTVRGTAALRLRSHIHRQVADAADGCGVDVVRRHSVRKAAASPLSAGRRSQRQQKEAAEG